MKLLHAPTSPFARKVRVVADELGWSDKIELVECAASRLKPNEKILPHNPLSQVPTLVLEDGTAISDSGVICEYLNQSAGGSLVPSSGEERWKILSGHAMGDGIMEAAQAIRLETAMRPAEFAWPQWIDAHKVKIQSAIGAIDREAESLSGRVDLATITYACALSYVDFRVPDLDWRQNAPAAAAWFATFSARPSMQVTHVS